MYYVVMGLTHIGNRYIHNNIIYTIRDEREHMRRIRYSVAMSLDGYIAGPNGENDWIIMDPDINFSSLMNSFDTILMGRRTFEAAQTYGGGSLPGMKAIVVSTTLRQENYPNVTIISENLNDAIGALRAEPGKDIWLYGGGALFRSLLNARLVDAVEVAIIPILLGNGMTLLPPPANRADLRLLQTRLYKTGIISLEYAVENVR